jgi:hypothetical protein
MRFLFCGGGSGGGAGGIQIEINTNPFDPNPRSAHRGRAKIVDSNSWFPKITDTILGSMASKEIENAVTEENKRQQKEHQAQQLAQRKMLIDRKRLQELNGQVNPLFAPVGLGSRSKGKAPFSTPPVTGVRLG